MKMSNRVDELEGYSIEMESQREQYNRQDFTSRTDKTPGTVRSNTPRGSGYVSAKHPIDLVVDELKVENENLKNQVRNYQHQINKIQGEKQQMYQSLSQYKLNTLAESTDSHNLKPQFKTPTTKAPTSSIKANHSYGQASKAQDASQSKASNKENSEIIIEYLRAEVSHCKDKYAKLESDFMAYKQHVKSQKVKADTLNDFMSEILRPAKDLIYQLCSDPHLSESYFYKEDDKFHGIEGKY